MFLKQVSIFIENKKGSIDDVILTLTDNDIQIKALSVCDNAEFGILRLIVNKPSEAFDLILKNGYKVKLADVIAIAIPNTPKGLAEILNIIKANNINITYIYSLVGVIGNKTVVILKTTNLEETEKLLASNNIEVVNPEEIY